jgi:hypothetical protein
MDVRLRMSFLYEKVAMKHFSWVLMIGCGMSAGAQSSTGWRR